jgi:hypothetical protein
MFMLLYHKVLPDRQVLLDRLVLVAQQVPSVRLVLLVQWEIQDQLVHWVLSDQLVLLVIMVFLVLLAQPVQMV